MIFSVFLSLFRSFILFFCIYIHALFYSCFFLFYMLGNICETRCMKLAKFRPFQPVERPYKYLFHGKESAGINFLSNVKDIFSTRKLFAGFQQIFPRQVCKACEPVRSFRHLCTKQTKFRQFQGISGFTNQYLSITLGFPYLIPYTSRASAVFPR